MIFNNLSTPILFILFNRYDTAIQVFERIREAKPSKLYFFADAPRENHVRDAENCRKARSIVDLVDWNCEVKINFLSENVGPRKAIGIAINWLFSTEEQGIILEHDCLPHPSFFAFCSTLLEYYKNDPQIMHISGNNFHRSKVWGDGSYYFSSMNHIWGFATWKRAWNHYDVNMEKYLEFKKLDVLNAMFSDRNFIAYWKDRFERIYNGSIVSWDYQWTFAIWTNCGLSILPQQNLVSNIGFDTGALNTQSKYHPMANVPTFEIGTITHPAFKFLNHKADLTYFYRYHHTNAWKKLKSSIKKMLRFLKFN